MADYKVLMVAPQGESSPILQKLTYAQDEIDQVVNLLRPKLLSGNKATIHGLLDMLEDNFDILWFATHGDENGIYLNDGLLKTSEITALVRSAKIRLVVLNTCSSRPVALTIYDELRIRLVCTVEKVPDRTAFITATLFARMLVRGLSFRQAFEEAKPGQNSTYTFIPEEESVMPQDKSQLLTSRNDDDVVNAIRRLQIVVQGDIDYNVDGLIPQVRAMSTKLDAVSDEILELKRNSQVNRRYIYLITLMTVALLIAVGVLVFQRGIL